MFRRPPTTIQLTQEDVLEYQDEKERKTREVNSELGATSLDGDSFDASKWKPKTPQTRSAAERIGITLNDATRMAH